MKTIEEKAKCYDEAIERAKKWYNEEEPDSYTCIVESIFPELKESEDEQHRKWILEYLYDGLRKSDEQFKGQFKCAIAWLEKQYADPIKEYWRGYREGKQGILDKYAELEKQGKKDEEILVLKDQIESLHAAIKAQKEVHKIKFEKQGEQNPAWSEKDEVMIKVLDSIIRYIVEIVDKDALERFGTNREELFSWLKSLRPQNKWKPSDEQMHAFEQVYDWYNNNFAPSETLTSFYNDLKKLKE